MSRFRSMAGTLALGALLAIPGMPARADLTIQVIPSLAPNAFGSPSWDGYVTNAINALENSLPTSGTPNDPTQYQALANGETIGANEVVVTGFPSWLGAADPGTAFGSQYANELGNRLHFGLIANDGPNATFSLSQLSFTFVSDNDPTNFNFSGDFSDPSDPSNAYSATRVGVILNSDGSVTYVTTGPATQLVNELFYVGVGNAYEPHTGDPGPTNQDKINHTISGIPDQTVTTTYTIGTVSGSASVNIASPEELAAVPEPSTFLSASLGVLVMGLAAWRRHRKVVAAS